jgi:hypothetical protein
LIYVEIARSFFVVSAAIGLGSAALAPGDFRGNWRQALAVCVGAPAAIIVLGCALAGLGWRVHAIL